MFFNTLVSCLIIQRLGEVVVARSNEKWMRKRGAVEYGERHYPFIVLLHVLFFLALFFEVIITERQLVPLWQLVLAGFLIVQVLRIWALVSLGRFWNTKILVLPYASIQTTGPYRFMKHPNYVVVALEFILIPVLFQAYFTMVVFSLLNALLLLLVRIPTEEKALSTVTNDADVNKNTPKFYPKVIKKV
ncbi:hypothetical protein EJF36_10785 [Bacillus sp. HMF5848]|uniref:isoprenylcysteine carboxyl methyltransferase family protein n=1 Tax=Bacillus sp. HMF5848 TaxID=2495421 RepID=UPI000F79CD80|nr:isoprenylcysteine carboxylmethyltransferase family protein [Bacillus sp. HMF5848]RSK27330.1 hypothetical protein EJF36_10785 [Bacillus sp. HMF5848]